MELDLLQISSGFAAGFIVGLLAMLIFNKIRSGSVSAGGVKQEFDEYKNDVEAHFEATSKKFQNMTEQYQDLYKHLATGATTLCRPDSVAAALADESDPSNKPVRIEAKSSGEAKKVVEASENAKAQAAKPKSVNETATSEAVKPAAAAEKPAASKPAQNSAATAKKPESEKSATAKSAAVKPAPVKSQANAKASAVKPEAVAKQS